MKNLPIKGVPSNYKKNIKTFQYNDFKMLEKIINNNSLAAVIMEVSRDEKPLNNFLKKVRKITLKKKIPLIFDECTSGLERLMEVYIISMVLFLILSYTEKL